MMTWKLASNSSTHSNSSNARSMEGAIPMVGASSRGAAMDLEGRVRMSTIQQLVG